MKKFNIFKDSKLCKALLIYQYYGGKRCNFEKKTIKTMKTIKYLYAVILTAFFITSCSVHTAHHFSSSSVKTPPGQAKKLSGSKSAKAYAPGQQKKK